MFLLPIFKKEIVHLNHYILLILFIYLIYARLILFRYSDPEYLKFCCSTNCITNSTYIKIYIHLHIFHLTEIFSRNRTTS